MAKKGKHKVRGGSKAAKAQKMSAIGDFIWRIKRFQEKVAIMKSSDIIVGWANDDDNKEKKRAMPKQQALDINAKRAKKGLKGKGEIVSNFDANFIGPGLRAASLATIARTMNYGRAGGINKKTGKPYGAIPARPFVDVLHNKFMKPIDHAIKDAVDNALDRKSTPETAIVAVNKIADVCKGQLQRAMLASNEYKANAPITINGGWMANVKNGKPFKIEPKGSSRPLYNSGTLINSVRFEVRKKGDL